MFQQQLRLQYMTDPAFRYLQFHDILIALISLGNMIAQKSVNEVMTITEICTHKKKKLVKAFSRGYNEVNVASNHALANKTL
jgi:hypothetical protein